MRKVCFFGSLLTLALGGCAHTGSGRSVVLREEATGISVVGEGRAMATPDRAVFHVGVEVRRPSVQEARAGSAEAIGRMLEALRGAGVAAEDVQTSQLTIQPEYEYTEQGRRFLGYLATNTLSVRVTDLDRVATAIDAAVTAGGDAARFDGLRFELVDPSAPRAEARRRAVEDARARAEQLAAASGVTLGDAVAVEEVQSGGQPPQPMMRMEAAAAPAGGPTPVAPGTTEIVVEVRARWEIRGR